MQPASMPTSTVARSSSRDAFWAEQAALDRLGSTPFDTVCDCSRPPFVRWFVGGKTNLCHNAVDRHLAARADQTGADLRLDRDRPGARLQLRELHAEVQRMAAVLLALGVGAGRPRADLHADGSRGGVRDARLRAHRRDPLGGVRRLRQRQPGQPHRRRRAQGGRQRRCRQPRGQGHRLQAAARRGDPPGRSTSRRRCCSSIAVWRRWSAMQGRDEDYRALRERHLDDGVPCTWLDSTHPSYTLYTSGTTGRPKGVQRDTGGYAVALAASMKHIFCGQPGETYFSTSDIGWVVGHSYIVYGPLIAGMATILYEGLPIRPGRGHLVEAGREVPRDVDVHRADRDPGVEEAGSGVPERARPVQPACAVPGRRAARRADRNLDRRRPRQARDRQLLADRDRLAHPDRRQGRRADAGASTAARAWRCTATTSG